MVLDSNTPVARLTASTELQPPSTTVRGPAAREIIKITKLELFWLNPRWLFS